nr:hypothetical protein [Gulosibacter sediminis]
MHAGEEKGERVIVAPRAQFGLRMRVGLFECARTGTLGGSEQVADTISSYRDKPRLRVTRDLDPPRGQGTLYCVSEAVFRQLHVAAPPDERADEPRPICSHELVEQREMRTRSVG